MKKDASKVKVNASTQDHLDIDDIRDDFVLLKSGGACVVITTTAVNFGLLSETEQDSLIYSYAGFLNSLSFSIQILVRSKRMDITGYLELLKQQEKTQMSDALRFQVQKYREFVSSIIQENKVLDKRFYLVIPFSPLELGIKTGATTAFLGAKSKRPAYSQDYILQKAKIALTPKRDNIIRLLSRMGLKAQALTTTELIKLFYEVYNPEEDIGQRVVSTQDYRTPLVQPAVDMPMDQIMDRFNRRGPNGQAVPAQPQRPPASARPVQRAPQSAGRRQPAPAARRAAGYGSQRPQPYRGQMPAAPRQPIARPLPPQAPAQAKPVSMQDVQSVLSRLQNEVTKLNGGK